MHLVERDQIERVTREQELASAGLTAANRARLGKLLGANVLVLLETDVSASTKGLGLLLCDSATGARFGQIRATNNTAGVTIMADEVRGALARFPQGTIGRRRARSHQPRSTSGLFCIAKRPRRTAPRNHVARAGIGRGRIGGSQIHRERTVPAEAGDWATPM
jgi:hypothetical protein